MSPELINLLNHYFWEPKSTHVESRETTKNRIGQLHTPNLIKEQRGANQPSLAS